MYLSEEVNALPSMRSPLWIMTTFWRQADSRLVQASAKYVIGQEIQLNSSEVHSFGIKARELSSDLYKQAVERYFRQ